MPYEDFTTYTEVDPNGHIAIASSTHIDVDGLTRGEDAYVYKDKGVDHFGSDFEHLLDGKPVSGTAWGYGAAWALTNDVDDLSGLKSANKTAIAVRWYRLGSVGNERIQITETYGGSEYAASLAISPNTQYYLRIKKQGTAFTCRVWTNASDRDNNGTGAASYVGELSLTLHADHSFRYIFAVCSYNDAQSAQTVTFDVDNLDLQEGGATYTKTWSADSLFKKLGIPKTLSVDAAFQKKGIQKIFGVDADFQKALTIQKQIDVLLKKTDLITTADLDVFFKKLDALKTFGVDVHFLRKDVIKSFAVDARFGVVGVVAYTKSFALDVVFAYKVRLPEVWLDEEGKIVLNVSRPYVWVGG